MLPGDMDNLDENGQASLSKPLNRIRNPVGGYQINKHPFKTSSFLNNIAQSSKSAKKLLQGGSANQINQKKGSNLNVKESGSKAPSKTGLELAYESFLVLAGYCADWGPWADTGNNLMNPSNSHGEQAQGAAGIKCFVGEGNNQKLVVTLLKERFRIRDKVYV
jgi:hypothetical protein